MDIIGVLANPVFADVGVGALLALVIILILTGRLVPRVTHERELAASNKRADEWKETTLKSQKLAEELTEQVGKFAEAAKTPSEFFSTVMSSGGDPLAEEDQANS